MAFTAKTPQTILRGEVKYMQTIKSFAMRLRSRAGLATGALIVSSLALVAPAGATATYDITPVTTSVTSELTANLPVILGAIGALIALGLAVKAVRKFVRV